MSPRTEPISYSPSTGNDLVAEADVPPAWSNTLLWIPLLGPYLNILTQAPSYFASLEDCVDFIAEDLTKGVQSEFVGHRVGVKIKRATQEMSSQV